MTLTKYPIVFNLSNALYHMLQINNNLYKNFIIFLNY